ncbi:MAG: TRAP transporter large permease [Desulfobacterales bacterium]|nr:TRAP transporter large permease [Desulfobacterales bacterium]
MTPEFIGLIGIIALFILLFMGIYIGIAMALVGFIGYSLIAGWTTGLYLFGQEPYATCSFYSFSIIPLFVLMGNFAFFSGMSEDIYTSVHKWVGAFPGGLAMATILGCAGFAAISGSSLATTSTMGTVTLPEMKRYNYHEGLATGSVSAGATLGILIPPSIGFVIYGILTEQSIGKLLMAGILPGVLLTGLFVITIYIICRIDPARGPAASPYPLKEKVRSLKKTGPILLLFTTVIGGIYSGVFSPMESAGIGAFGAFAIALFRRKLTLTDIIRSLQTTLKTTAMIFLTLIGAEIFTRFLSVSMLPMQLAEVVAGMNLPNLAVLCGILVLLIILGCVLDGIAMIILTLPILFPMIEAMGYDPIWFGVLMVIVLEMGLITPPVGMNVFILKGVAREVPLETIFRGIIPFLIASIIGLIIIMILPEIALYIPNKMAN